MKCHWKKILKNWLRERRHKNVDKSVFPTLLNALVSKIDRKLLKSGFSGLYPVDKSKPMKKIMNMQPKHDEVHKSNEKEDNVVKTYREQLSLYLHLVQVNLH